MSSQTHCSICTNHLRNHGIWCTICGYIHVKCSGLPSRKDWFSDFVCPRCVASTGIEQSRTESPPDHAALSNPTPHVTQATVSQTPPEEPSVSDFWTKVSPEVATQFRNFYNEIVHWRPCFQQLTKNKTGHKFVETLDCLLAY